MAVTRAIDLRTEIPGPRSREIVERKHRSVADPLSLILPIVAADGRGATLTDVDGNTFIDFTGGVGCLNVGHAHPRVVEAVQEQAARFLHTDFTIVPYEVYVTLAERLLALAPFTGPAKAAFFNAGTEAVENAVKFARAYTGRPAVIAFEGGFHGRTLLSLTLTSKVHPYKAGLGPFAPEVYRVPFPNEYRGVSSAQALDALERAFVTQVAVETVAAIVIEPVQGEGGFLVAPPEFLQGVRSICDAHGIVLVADEVQTGYGRTGRMFAIEHSGVEPDLITVAKSIAGGLPLSGVLGKAAIMDAPGDSAVGGTYVGNPVAQAAALAVLDVFEDEGLVDRAVHIGDVIRARMSAWQARLPRIGDVRGLGAMLAIELVQDPATKRPAPDLATAVVEHAAAHGLLLLKAGTHSNCIRVLCPLVIADAELDEALDVWEEALGAVLA
jgi:4-aminobutyrate aminotransferase/(S)-3-amino-2-methylpropionate transaminase